MVINLYLALQTLDQMTNCHTRWNGVGVDDDVRCETLAREQHVLLSVLDSTGSLLPVTRGKFVSNLRDAYRAHSDLAELVALRVESDHHLIYDSSFTVPEESAGVSLGIPFGGTF